MSEIKQIEKIRHSLAHLLAIEATKFDPDVKVAIGPIIEDGFYYDFEFSEDKQPTENDLKTFQKGMKKATNKKQEFAHEEVSVEKAKELFANQPFKLELIDELIENGDKLTIYRSDNFFDLCAGPHVESTDQINADSFKLTKIAGAYWRGNENNKMLTRIYGVAFETNEELKEYEERIKRAEEIDHRKIGKEMDLFTFSDLVGPGLPLYTPKGTAVIDALQRHIEKVCRGYGFEKVKTPHLSKIALFETSGHAQKFADELFSVTSAKKHNFALKPVQCPHQTQIYDSKTRSYKDLPIRYMESDRQYRAEKSGEVGGLSRVYAITVEDGHVFCTVDQIKAEIQSMVNIIKDFYEPLGLLNEFWISLSVRDPLKPENYIGDEKDWETAEKMLREISDEMSLNAKRCEGEAALYGPKLDFMFKDALGKEIQIPTIQLDFATPKRFNLTYIDNNGKKVPPVMIHRAILGSYERLLVLLIEHTEGNFPLWLAPVQIKILPVMENHNQKAKEIYDQLKALDYRVEMDDSDDALGKKVRRTKIERVPYFLIIGDKDIEQNAVSVESRDNGQIGSMTIEEFIQKIKQESSL